MSINVGTKVASNIIKNSISSVAPKAKIRKICKDVKSVIYMRCRLTGSGAMWFWLARIIRGRSQQVKIRRGVETRSVAK